MGTTDNTLLETYDLGFKRWIGTDSNSLMPVANIKTLLFRARGVTEGKGMVDEEERLENHGKPRKRPAEFPTSSMDRSVKSRREQTAPEAITAPISAATQPSVSDSVSKVITLSTSPCGPPAMPTLSRHLEQSLGPLTLAGGHSSVLSRRNDTLEISDSESEPEIPVQPNMSLDGSRKSATNKAPWPLKYVVDMAKGFDARESMSGTVKDTFQAAFGEKWAKTCWSVHHGIWRKSTQAERDQYIATGHSKAGKWRAFVKNIKTRCRVAQLWLQLRQMATSTSNTTTLALFP